MAGCAKVTRFDKTIEDTGLTEIDSTGRGWDTPALIDLGGLSGTYVSTALAAQENTFRDFELRATPSQAVLALAARSGASTRAVVRRYQPRELDGAGWEGLGGASTTFSTTFNPTDVLIGIGSDGQAIASFWSGTAQTTAYLSDAGDWRDFRTTAATVGPVSDKILRGTDGQPYSTVAVSFWPASPRIQDDDGSSTPWLDNDIAGYAWNDRLFAYGRSSGAGWDSFGNAYASRLHVEGVEHVLVTQKYVPDAGWTTFDSAAGEVLSALPLGSSANVNYPQVQVLNDGFGVTVLARTEIDYSEPDLSLTASARLLSQWIVGNSVVQGAPTTGLETKIQALVSRLNTDTGVTDTDYSATSAGTSVAQWSAVLNAILIKLDDDAGVTDTDYEALHTWISPSLDDRVDAFNNLLLKLDLDSGVDDSNYSVLALGTTPTKLQRVTAFNSLLSKLDDDADVDDEISAVGVADTDYVTDYGGLVVTDTEIEIATRFNSVLAKLDADAGVADSDYSSSLALDTSQDDAEELIERFNQVLAKLDNDTGVSGTRYEADLLATRFGPENLGGLGVKNPQLFSAATDGHGNVVVVFYDQMDSVSCSADTEPVGSRCDYRLYAATRGATGVWSGPSRIDLNLSPNTTTFYQGESDDEEIGLDDSAVQGGQPFAKPGVVALGEGQFMVVYAGTDLLARTGFVRAVQFSTQNGWDSNGEQVLATRCLTGGQTDCTLGDIDYSYRPVNDITAASDGSGEALFVLHEVYDDDDLTTPELRRLAYRALRYSRANGGWATDVDDGALKLTWLNTLADLAIPRCRMVAGRRGYDLPNCNRNGAQAAIFSTGEAVIVFPAPVSERTDNSAGAIWQDALQSDYENQELYMVEYR